MHSKVFDFIDFAVPLKTERWVIQAKMIDSSAPLLARTLAVCSSLPSKKVTSSKRTSFALSDATNSIYFSSFWKAEVSIFCICARVLRVSSVAVCFLKNCWKMGFSLFQVAQCNLLRSVEFLSALFVEKGKPVFYGLERTSLPLTVTVLAISSQSTLFWWFPWADILQVLIHFVIGPFSAGWNDS